MYVCYVCYVYVGVWAQYGGILAMCVGGDDTAESAHVLISSVSRRMCGAGRTTVVLFVCCLLLVRFASETEKCHGCKTNKYTYLTKQSPMFMVRPCILRIICCGVLRGCLLRTSAGRTGPARPDATQRATAPPPLQWRF